MTLIGLFFLIAIAFSWKKGLGGLFFLLIISCVFSASSMLNIGEKSIPPYFFVAISIVMYYVIHYGHNVYRSRFTRRILLFIFYSIIIGLISPNLFEGIKVLPSNLDFGIAVGGVRLTFGLGNIAQLLYVFVNMTALACIWNERMRISKETIENAFITTLFIALVLGYWDYISKLLGLPFPTEFFLNSVKINAEEGSQVITTVSGYMRFSSLFTEASYCGAFLAASFWTLCYLEKNKKIVILIILCAVACVLTMSGTTVVALIGGLMILLLKQKKRAKYIFFTLCVCVIIMVLIPRIQILSSLVEVIGTKSASHSGTVRSESIVYSYNVFCDTYLIGAGFGSTRSSSFLFDFLAAVGVPGLILFLRILIPIIRPSLKEFNYVSVYVVVFFIAQIIAIPDFSFGCFWLGMFMLVAVYPVNYKEKEESCCVSN